MCEVLIATGEMFHEATDFDLPGHPPFLFERSYSAAYPERGPLGTGWRHNWQFGLRFDGDELTLREGSDQPIVFNAAQADGKKFPVLDLVGGSVLTLTFADRRRLLFHRAAGPAWSLSELIDSQGHWTRLDYRASQLASLIDASGRIVTLAYSNGLICAVTVAHRTFRETVTFDRDSHGRLIQVADSIGPTDVFEYRGDLIVRHTRGGLINRFFCYDGDRRCIYNWYNEGYKFRHLQFRSDKRAVLVTDSYGFPELFRLDENAREIAHIDPLHRTTLKIYGTDGELLSEIPPAGVPLETGFIQSRGGTQLLVTIDGRGSQTSYDLDSAGRSHKIRDASGQTLEFIRDEYGNVTEIRGPENTCWRFSYDQEGSLTRWTTPVGESIYRTESGGRVRLFDDEGDIAAYQYDEAGNLMQFSDGVGRTTTFQYLAQDLLAAATLPDGRQIRWEYDQSRRISKVIDAVGNATQFEYSLFGTPVHTLYADGSATGATVDLEDNVTELRNSLGDAARFVYDQAFRTREIVSFDGRIDRYEYNDSNEVCRYTDPTGRTKELAYDDNGNLTEARFPDGLAVRYEFDELDRVTAVLAVAPEGSTGAPTAVLFKYNANDYVTAETTGRFSAFFDHDAAGNLVGIRSTLGRKLAFEVRRRLTRKLSEGSDEFRFDYSAAGELTRITMPNGMEQRLTFDTCARLTRREVFNRENVLVAWRAFSYDDADRLARISDWRIGDRRYRYDNRDRLTAVLSGSGQVLEEYQYDSEHNLLGSHDIAASTVMPGNRLTGLGQSTISYDDWGNITEITGREVTSLVYGSLEHLESVSRDGVLTGKYEYDLLLRRTRKTTPTDDVRFYYHVNLLSTLDSVRHGRWDFTYIPDTFIPLSQAGPSGRYYYSFDQIGTPTEIWDSRGSLVAAISSEAFGTKRRVERFGGFDGPTPFHFAGQYVDEESGLHYSRFRYYWPAAARFTSQDPVGFTAGLNLYTYPTNPMNWIDPLGLIRISISCKPSEGNFTPCEQKALMIKVAQMNADLTAQPRKQRCTDCRKNKQKKYFKKKCKGSVPKGYQVDHVQELQLGGADKCCKNLMAIPARPNASAGAQIHAKLEANPNKVISGITLKNPACNRAHECKSDPVRRGKDAKSCEDPKPIVC